MDTNHSPRSIPARIVYRIPLYSIIGADQKCDSAAMERSARFVAVLLLRHGGSAAAEFSENRDRLFAGVVEPINTYAVVGVSVFRDLEHIGRSAVVKFHGQRIRREDVVGDVAAPLSGDIFICHCTGAVWRTDQRQNCNRYKPRVFHGTTLPLLENPQALYVKRNDGETDFVSRIHRKLDFGQTGPTFRYNSHKEYHHGASYKLVSFEQPRPYAAAGR